MYYQICVSGTSIPVEETKELKTLEEINSWLNQNQISKPIEGELGFDSWEYVDTVKYIFLSFSDEGVFTAGPSDEENPS
jgi:hypothetical protein